MSNWDVWSADDIARNLPRLVDQVGERLDEMSEEHKQRDLAAVTSLRSSPATSAEIRSGTRQADLMPLAFALNVMADWYLRDERIDDALDVLHAAHEIFRGGDVSRHPTTQMRQVLQRALRVLLNRDMKAAEELTTDAGLIREKLMEFVKSSQGAVLPQVELQLNEMVLLAFERVRASRSDDTTFEREFVRANVAGVLEMEVPTRLGEVQDRWEDTADHVAPDAARTARAILRRPKDLSSVVGPDFLTRLRSAVERADVDALRATLLDKADDIEANLRLRLTAKFDYRKPESEMRFRNQPDRFFLEAREALSANNATLALERFKTLNFRNPTNTFAKEWYAFALAKFGTPGDIHEIIGLLEESLGSEFHRPDAQWVARWNLARALLSLPTRAEEALDRLLPLLENDTHETEVLELCLLWAMEQDRDDLVGALLVKSPYYEAQLLAALRAAEGFVDSPDARREFSDHFRRLNKILQDPDRVLPQPAEELNFEDLNGLTRTFVELSMAEAGVEWFRQRRSYGSEWASFKNWECEAQLNEEIGDSEAAWRCRRQQVFYAMRNKNLYPDRKSTVLRYAMGWAQRNGFQEAAVELLKQHWKSTALTEAEVLMLEQHLTPSVIRTPVVPPVPSPDASPDEVIQKIAPLFSRVTSVQDLGENHDAAEALLEAVGRKHPSLASESTEPLREILRLSARVRSGVDEEQAQQLADLMRDQLNKLKARHNEFPTERPFDLSTLAQACARVVENFAVRTRPVPELRITPPSALGERLSPPTGAKDYTARLLIRVSNAGLEEASDIQVSLMSGSEHAEFLENDGAIAKLPPEGDQVWESTLEVHDGLDGELPIRVHATYNMGGISRTVQVADHVPVEVMERTIPVTQRYVTSGPVSPERTDLFHGRDKEMKQLLEAFDDGHLAKLYFVNGIRAVGKSSLMYHLGRKANAEVFPLIVDLERALTSKDVDAAQLVRQIARDILLQVDQSGLTLEPALRLPGAEEFSLDPAWTVLDGFLAELRIRIGRPLLLCFDELQRLVKEIADPSSPMDDGFLAWLRSKIQTRADIFLVCTGSEPYSIMHRRFEHNLWRNMEAFDISFVDRDAMCRIVTESVKQDGVRWLPEALDRLWDMTEGHPWVVQKIAEKVCYALNDELRRIVGPEDVERAARLMSLDSQIIELWWNEKDGLLSNEHRQIAFLLLQHQGTPRAGVPESTLIDACLKSGIRAIPKYLDEMRALEVLTLENDSAEPRWRVRGAFLEKYLTTLMQRTLLQSNSRQLATAGQPLAVLLDWENAKISLLRRCDELPESDARRLRDLIKAAQSGIATRLLDLAARRGILRQRWAVADWDRAIFAGEQKAFTTANYHTAMAGDQKKDASDKVLTEKIHEILREHPYVDVYVIATGDADFHEVIATLREKGKSVVLWPTRAAVSGAYGEALRGPDRLEIEWLDDLLLEE